MNTFSQLIQALCVNLDVDFDAEGEFFLLETADHDATVCACALPSGAEGLSVQIQVCPLPHSSAGLSADALFLLHRLNHDARSEIPWRILLDENDELLIEQLCRLDQVDANDLERALVDGLQRAGQLKELLRDWIDDDPITQGDQRPSLGAGLIFG